MCTSQQGDPCGSTTQLRPPTVLPAQGRRTPTMSDVGGDRPSTDGAGSLSGPGPVLPLETEAVLAPAAGDEPGETGSTQAKVRGRSPGQLAWARLRSDKVAV